jgi:predicted esterase/catechol 2,3-dioxygenase-like lactoylglutathione lyase family enzyme
VRRGTGADGEQVLAFRDHDGLMLELVGNAGAEARPAWGGAPGIPREHAIHGFHSVTLWVERLAPTERVLTETLGFRAVGEDESTRRYAVGSGGPGTRVNVREVGGFGRGAGAGTVHHVAFAVADDDAQLQVRGRVEQARLNPTPVIDRNYFHSVYFREPGGVLYEIATNPPGFTADEPLESLGESLKLPPQYEGIRSEIEAALPRIHLPVAEGLESIFASSGPEDVSGDALGFVHRYHPPSSAGELAGGVTLLLLHGTGGDEDDLVPLGRTLLPGAGLLSPRGNVRENGAARYFRRIAEGVFDQEDLALRTNELAEFITGAARVYDLDAGNVVAVGFSNGANIAASMLLKRAGVFRAAVLLAPMIPFEPETLPDLSGTSVFIGAGRTDTMVPADKTERLAALLRESGADVTVHWDPGGHAITKGEIRAAEQWMKQFVAAGTARRA